MAAALCLHLLGAAAVTGSGRWTSGAGLLVGPVLWAVNMQASQILPYVDCGAPFRSGLALSALSVMLTLGAGWVSWRGRGAPRRSAGRFMAIVGTLVALVFAFALALQAAAGAVLSGCER
jgi:hypothetical protein